MLSGLVRERALLAAALASVVSLTAASGVAQNYRDVAPRVPATGPVPGVEPPAPAVSQDQRQIVPVLKGLAFVPGSDQVQKNGIGRPGVDVDRLALLQDPAFQLSMQGYLGQPLTFAKLGEITHAVIELYRRKDHPLVDVIVPQQDVSAGVVQIAVLEFRVGQVRPEGNQWFSDELLRSEVHLQPGDQVLASELSQDLAVLNDNPFRRVDVVYERSREVGRTDLVLRTQDRLPLRVYAGGDDSGTRALGINHVFAGFNVGRVLGLDHQLSYQATASDDLLWGNPDFPGRSSDPRFLAHSATYAAPLPWRDRLTFYGLYANENPRPSGGVAGLLTKGYSDQLSVRYGHPFMRSDNGSHEVRIGYDFKEANNSLEFGNTVQSSPTAISQWVLEYTGQISDSLGSTGITASLFGSPGRFTHQNTDAFFNAARAGATAAYFYALLGAERITALPAGLSWSARGSLQLTGDPLLASEQFGLGGPTTVRGYDQYLVEGDSGWLVVNELRSPQWQLFTTAGGLGDRLQLIAFSDVGHVRSIVLQPTQPAHATLASAGLGFRYGIDRYLDVRVDYGWQLIRLAGDPGARSRGHFSLVLSY